MIKRYGASVSPCSTPATMSKYSVSPSGGLAKNYRGITLTSIAAKIYNALLRNCIEPKIDNILRKNQNGFRRNRSTTSQILTIRRILEGVWAKNLQATLIFVDFTKAFDSIHRGKMEQILLAYGIPKETVAAITIIYIYIYTHAHTVYDCEREKSWFVVVGIVVFQDIKNKFDIYNIAPDIWFCARFHLLNGN